MTIVLSLGLLFITVLFIFMNSGYIININRLRRDLESATRQLNMFPQEEILRLKTQLEVMNKRQEGYDKFCRMPIDNKDAKKLLNTFFWFYSKDASNKDVSRVLKEWKTNTVVNKPGNFNYDWLTRTIMSSEYP